MFQLDDKRGMGHGGVEEELIHGNFLEFHAFGPASNVKAWISVNGQQICSMRGAHVEKSTITQLNKTVASTDSSNHTPAFNKSFHERITLLNVTNCQEVNNSVTALSSEPTRLLIKANRIKTQKAYSLQCVVKISLDIYLIFVAAFRDSSTACFLLVSASHPDLGSAVML